MERTLVLIKPDATKRGIVHKILGRLERKGLQPSYFKMWNNAPLDLIKEHYAEHKGRIYFERLCTFMTSGTLYCLIYEGDEIIASVRKLIGDKLTLGTIRGDLTIDNTKNLIHGSDKIESAYRETNLWINYQRKK